MTGTPYDPVVDSSLHAGTPEKKTWRPWPLRPPFLIGFIVLCIILCIGIEMVIRGCTPGGCHGFGQVTTEQFTYNQLPTVLSVFLGLVWAVPHHDIMRLEPYFRMSVPGGTSAADSLLLDYPYTFAPLVPYFAAKRRHHEVLLSSCIALTMGFLVTPLISVIFDDALLSRDIPATALRGVLRPVTANSTLSGQFTYEAYNHLWHDRPLPAFTQPGYAMLPLVPNNTTKSLPNQEDWVINTEDAGDEWKTNIEVWTANTTLFEAEMKCEPTIRIAIETITNLRIRVNITSEDGEYSVHLCDQKERNFKSPESLKTSFDPITTGYPISYGELPCDGYTTFITPWTSIAQRVDSSPRTPDGSEVYLFGWASGRSSSWPYQDLGPHPTDITAIFCTTHYYSEQVTASFEMPYGKLVRVSRAPVREPFLGLLNFDAIINGDTGAAHTDANNADDSIFGYRPAQGPNDDSQLRLRFGDRASNIDELFVTNTEYNSDQSSHSKVYIENINGLPGFALSGTSLYLPATLLDPTKLASIYSTALQTIFALAVTQEMVSVDPNASDSIPVTRTIFLKGFKVNTPWARGAQGGLVVVVLMATLLTVLMSRRPCNLDGEPNSLAEALRLLAASPEVCTEMENAEFHRPEELAEVLNDGQGLYILDLVPGHGPRILRTSAAFRKHSRPLTPVKPNQGPWTGQLWQLRFMTGLIFLTFFWVVGVLLSVAFGYSRTAQGLPLSANLSSFPRKVVFSFIPIAIGMAAEPIFITIAICQCMIAPYAMLTRGTPTSSEALAVDFDKSPPHFQIVRSLRTRNIPLAALTLSILLCNVLAVALAGLFTITDRPLDSTEVVTYPNPIVFTNKILPEQEMYHVLAEQLSGHSDDLPFTTPEYYMIPVLANSRVVVEQFEASTIGVGLDVNCSLIPEEDITLTCVDALCDREESAPRDLPYDYTAFVDNPCWPLLGSTRPYRPPNRTDHYTWKGLSHDNIVQSSRLCQNDFFPLWVERSLNSKVAGSVNRTNGNTYLDSLIMQCRAVQKAVQLDIVVSKNSRLKNVSPVRALNPEEMTQLYKSTSTDQLSLTFFGRIDAALQTRNTLDRHNMRWMNHLMRVIEPKIVRNSSHIPDRAHVVSAFEEVYRRLFVIFLKLSEDDVVILGSPETIVVKATVTAWRVDVSRVMYCLAGSIILVMVVVLVLLYWHRQQTVGYLPTTLAGLYALLYASNAKEECGELYGRDPAERAKNLQDVGGLYACGRFADGEHYGVHRTGKLAGPETEAE